jgi:hypothetical protein
VEEIFIGELLENMITKEIGLEIGYVINVGK